MLEKTSDINGRNGAREGVLILMVIAFLFLLISCSDSTINTAETMSKTDKLAPVNNAGHTSFLSSSYLSKIAGQVNKPPAGHLQTANGDGFVSPLFGLATAPNGDILVADAGAGISTIDGTNEISLPGVSDMSPLGRASMWAVEGLTGEPGEDTGQALYRVSKGKTQLTADLFAYEEDQNPDGAELIDSNPFDVQSINGRSALVIDAAGNDLLKIDNQGNIELIALFPDELVSTANIKNLFNCPSGPEDICGLPADIPAQAVPTSIAVGPDGSYYVGELKGFPAPANASNIWRILPDASDVMCGTDSDCEKMFDGGFTSIIDLAFDDEGYLHVVELDENSWFALELGPGAMAGGTINKCDLDAQSCTEVASGIPIITSITFGTDGSLWATRNALIPESAEVFEVD